ncbi:MAG: ferric reductase-like transmembrane domain-containing protein [Actinomycetota bacterium]|nr:ferric reductase-like transmembrane domain-containing protein [Actinomycetota bacterium]
MSAAPVLTTRSPKPPADPPVSWTGAGPGLRSSRHVGDPGWWRDAAAAFTWLSLLAVVALWVSHGGLLQLGTVAGALTATGRLTGLVASDLILIQVLLMARIPFVERSYGQDELARRHRLVGFTSFNLLWAHIVLITLGYAAGSAAGLWGTLLDLVLNYPGMLLAVAGTLALCMVVVTSVKKARRRLRYESWHLLHLYAYLGAGLALPHQLWTGADFVRDLPSTVFWWGLYAAAVGSVLWFRVGLPLALNLRLGLVVDEVRAEGPNATTVVVRGRHLAQFRVRAGQFFTWRFLGAPGWSHGHPYSLSAAPDGRRLRLTAEHLGDGSAALRSLRPGSRVLVEGPYGRLHVGARQRQKVLLMASGIGVTPMRALLEELPQSPGDVVLVYRVHSMEDALFTDELAGLARARGASLLTVPGPRLRSRPSWLPERAGHLSDADALRHLVPDVADRAVLLCGNPAWMDLAGAAAQAAGVPPEQIHLERFAY